MSDQRRTMVYQKALDDAQSELDEMLDEFNALASRKTQLEHAMQMLTPLLDAYESQPASQTAPAQQDFAPLSARSFQPPAAQETQHQVRHFAKQEIVEAAPVETAQAQVAFEVQPVALAETSQPEPQVVLQQQETPNRELQPASSGDRLEDRINFALNFALLS